MDGKIKIYDMTIILQGLYMHHLIYLKKLWLSLFHKYISFKTESLINLFRVIPLVSLINWSKPYSDIFPHFKTCILCITSRFPFLFLRICALERAYGSNLSIFIKPICYFILLILYILLCIILNHEQVSSLFQLSASKMHLIILRMW